MKNLTNMPKASIFSPYLNTSGGGERYIFSIADTLSKKYATYLYADRVIKEESLDRFGISLDKVHFLSADLLEKQNLLKRYNSLRQYDLFIYMTDGSIFFSGAKKNLLVVQSPLHIPKSNFLNNLKLTNWQIICYSQFMKTIIQKNLGKNIKISTLAPCIDVSGNGKKIEKKENIILTVGRFFPYPHDKKQGVLINIFKHACKKYFSDWKLIIAGGFTEEGGRNILTQLKDMARGFPIEIMINLSASTLNKLYKKAKIYWHATGFGEDLEKYPERAEHFGIAPLEAMAHGAVPLVYNGGGLKDIIIDGKDGYLWSTSDELVKKTYNLITNDNKLFYEITVRAISKANQYSCDKFYAKLEKIIHN